MKIKKLFCWIVLCVCLLVSCELPAEPVCIRENIEDSRLCVLMQKRLDIMHEVARAKWNQKLPVENKERELEVLSRLLEKAREYGLDEQGITQFFQSQFELAKEIQRRDFFLWQELGVLKFDDVLDLKMELRAQIDKLDQEMIELIRSLL